MISVLIPVYNWNIKTLVEELLENLNSLPKNINNQLEIIVLDDCSTQSDIKAKNLNYAQSVSSTNFFYFENETNQGDAETRNKLVKKAKNNWLLFLDVDVRLNSKSFIKEWLEKIQSTDKALLVGRIAYNKNDFKETNSLRWNYGNQVESVLNRSNFYTNIRTAHLMVKKSLLQEISFTKLGSNYTATDVYFAHQLEKRNLPIEISNLSVDHIGLEDNIVFLKKTEQALENYILLLKQNNTLVQEFKIVKIFLNVKKLKMNKLLVFGFSICKELLKKNLCSKNPNIKLFQIYKLGYLAHYFTLENRSNKASS